VPKEYGKVEVFVEEQNKKFRKIFGRQLQHNTTLHKERYKKEVTFGNISSLGNDSRRNEDRSRKKPRYQY
jgi:hypothetical protein